MVSDSALHRVYFPTEKWSEHYERNGAHPLITLTKTQLAEFFAGERRIFDIPLSPEGTLFQQKVWNMLRRIPYGKTWSYAEEAKRVGKASATRAVASANGRNPIPIIIPCHRVVPKGGGTGGYSGGVERKMLLLKLEQHYLAPTKQHAKKKSAKSVKKTAKKKKITPRRTAKKK